MNYKNKVTIIGAGMVGSTTAYTLVVSGIAEEIALIDINKNLAKSQVMDLQHSFPFWGYKKIKAGDYNDLKDSEIVIITCGATQKGKKTRLDLVKENSSIMRDIIPKIFKKNPNIVILMVTNPVDVLTYQAIKMFPKKKSQIIGSGTILDSARFRFLLGEHLGVNPKSIHAYIVGEHGDSELPLWSTASIGNTKITNFKKLSLKDKKKIFEKAKNAAYTIIEGKQATYYAVAACVAKIIKAVMLNKKTVLPLSHLMEGEYGIKDICLSMPVVLGSGGVQEKVNPEISREEQELLKESARRLKKAAREL